MPDRVLDQRLDEEAGHRRIHHIRIDSHVDPQRVAKANPLDGEVVVEERQLLGQRNFLAIPDSIESRSRSPRCSIMLRASLGSRSTCDEIVFNALNRNMWIQLHS